MASDSETFKRKLNDLRVVDLRAELECRGIDKSGVKAVLIERLQHALEKEGYNPDEYLFDVIETPVKKNPKRTNKKLTRDDESETHSNVDETLNDTVDEDDKAESDKQDSDDDAIDEKFFQVLETTDGGEDAIELSIEEEEEKLLNEECEPPTSDGKDKAQDKGRAEIASRSEDESSFSPPNKKEKICNIINLEDKTTEDEKDAAETLTNKTDMSLIVSVEEGQNDLESELASLQQSSVDETSKTDDSSVEVSNCDRDAAEVSDDKIFLEEEEADRNSEDMVKKKTVPADNDDKSIVEAATNEKEDKAKSSTVSTTESLAKDGKTPDKLKATKVVGSGKNLWVTGLSSNTRATDLKVLFSKYGKVVGAKIVSNTRSSGSRCYGFVTMAAVEDATKCIENLHRTELHGRTISVEKAKAEPVSASKKLVAKIPIVAKKTPEKKEVTKKEEVNDKKEEDLKDKEKESVKSETSEKTEKEKSETKDEEKESDKEAAKEEVRKRSHRSSSRRSSRERTTVREGYRPFLRDSRRPFRRPMLRRPYIHRPRNPLTFRRITDERLRQRSREFERQNREEERRRHQDIIRQREIERKQREEAIRLERERERLRMEREKLERERAEVLRLEREKQRMERERIEREREELRKNRERLTRIDDTRRPFKRPFENPGNRDNFENRKRFNVGPSRFISSGSFHNDGNRRSDNFDRKNDHFENIRRDVPRRDATVSDHDDRRPVDRGGIRNDRFVSRDTDLRGHGRDDRGASYRDGNSSVHRPGAKDDWKNPTDRRGDSWQSHGGTQSDHRDKSYSSGGGIGSGPRDQWGGDRKADGSNQSWGRSDGVQGGRWSGVNSSGRGQQSMGLSQSVLSQQSSVYGPQSGGSSSGMMGGGMSGGSFSSDRFDAYKSQSSLRRY